MSTSIIPGPNVFRAVSGSLFSSPVNWSRGVVPTGSDVAMIADNCTIDISRTIGSLVVRAPFTASINTGLTLNVKEVIDVKGHLSCSGAPNIISEARKNNINSFSPGSSTFTYTGSNQNVPGVTYNNLTVLNGGTKVLIGNTIVNGNLSVYNSTNIPADNPTLEIGANSLFVSGTTRVNCAGNGNNVNAYLKKNSAVGNVTFVGQLILNTYRGVLDFSVGSPNVEVRSGINLNNWGGVILPGTSTWTISTNNQQWDLGSDAAVIVFYNLIIDNITLRHYGGGGSTIAITNSMNGTTLASSYIGGNNLNAQYWLRLDSNIVPMTTGSYDVSTYNDGGMWYNFAGSFNIPLSQYGNLYITNSGTKTLTSNTTILRNFTCYSSVGNLTLELSDKIFNVEGSTTIVASDRITRNSFLKKNSPIGLVTFGGMLYLNASGGVGGTLDFSVGNPNVEVKNGINISNQPGTIISGNGQWKFSTNNQNIITSDNNTHTFQNILISGAITLGFIGSATPHTLIIGSSINGDNINSKFIAFTNSIYNYQGSTQPMVTGILDTSTNLNTWIYGSGSQDIKGNTYRNLTLNGGGTKTLQGNVSVQNTYTLTAPATVNNNGFTLTNP